MEISFLGGVSIKIKTKNLVLLTDPKSAKEKADVVVYTSPNEIVVSGPVNRESTFYIKDEGEYELSGVGIIVSAVPVVTADGVSIAFLSGLSNGLTDAQIEKLSEVDVIAVPLAQAATLIEQIQPSVAILIGYERKDEVDQFLTANKFEIVKRDLDKLKIDENNLAENTEVVVLNA
ncbi:hypothetical protein HYS10_01010 [Candidatus Collierbacteria bacterium]|nr:hypothetical protein [Candidatus Collierbacteria bacterium]